MKKISLKKEVVARISDNEASHLKGGQTDNACPTATHLPCMTPPPGPPLPPPPPDANTCGTAWTCNG